MKDVPLENFVCEKPVLKTDNNCSTTTTQESTDCIIHFKEGLNGKINCSGTGKPIPQVQILRGSGMPLTNQGKG